MDDGHKVGRDRGRGKDVGRPQETPGRPCGEGSCLDFYPLMGVFID
jgi:hypothetical protein